MNTGTAILGAAALLALGFLGYGVIKQPSAPPRPPPPPPTPPDPVTTLVTAGLKLFGL